MDRTEQRYRAAMVRPRSGGLCRFCEHRVIPRHVGTWCADCHESGEHCRSEDFLANRQAERSLSRVTK